MSEAKLWEDIRVGMATRWHAQRHEDKYSTGIPDVSFGLQKRSEGWMELKYLPGPPRATEKLGWDFAYDHFVSDQRNWLESRHRYGPGRIFLLARFGPEVTAVWNWARIRQRLGVESWVDIIKAANAQWWHGRIDYDELGTVLADNRIITPRYKL